MIAPTTLNHSSPERNGHSKPRTATLIPAVPPRKLATGWVLSVVGVVAIGLAGAFTAGTLPRLQQEHAVNAAATERAAAAPRVTVARARQATVATERVLPGNTLPLLEASLYSRATGYLKQRNVDIGDRVQEGQLLAEISAPDVDDQLAQAEANLLQARADLELAKANRTLAEVTLERDLKAKPGIATTLQQIDQDRATVDSTRAKVEAARAAIQVQEATVQRFRDLKGFQRITAPFTGVITARKVDPGDLLTADNVATRELFHVMQTDTLRVMINVPQVLATDIKPGQTAVVFRREDPAKGYTGKVVRTANALDPATRTLLTEVHVANPHDALRPGMYLQVKFTVDRALTPVLVPATALVTRTAGTRVAVVDDNNRVQYRAVQLGRDYGAEVEVLAGLAAGERVLLQSGDDLAEGTAVQPQEGATAGAKL
jgi:RND family efflux transporter MFP subunit